MQDSSRSCSVLLQWPTFITLIMFPIMAAVYVRLAHREEVEVRAEFGPAWDEYAARTPRFIPVAGTFTWHSAGLTTQRKSLGRCTMLSMKRYAWLCVAGGEVAYFICLFGGYLPMHTERAMEIHKALFETLPGFVWGNPLSVALGACMYS
jgi:hypothetical protein